MSPANWFIIAVYGYPPRGQQEKKSRDRVKKSGVPEEGYFLKTNSETYPSGPVSLLARQAPRMMYAQATK